MSYRYLFNWRATLMDLFDEKIQSIRHICKQLEELDIMLAKLQDKNLIQECQKERNSQLAQLKRLLN